MCVHRETQVQRCVKVLRKNKLTPEERKQFQEEYQIMLTLVSYIYPILSYLLQDHPNIVRMYEFFEDEKRYYVINELC